MTATASLDLTTTGTEDCTNGIDVSDDSNLHITDNKIENIPNPGIYISVINGKVISRNNQIISCGYDGLSSGVFALGLPFGVIDIDYETHCGEKSVMEMGAKISGKGDDLIKISETVRISFVIVSR